MITLHPGNSLAALRRLPTASVDAVVTDPPYGLGAPPDPIEMLRAWLDGDHLDVTGGGFMGRQWDAFVPQPGTWREVWRVLKPGGHLLAFFGTRTFDVGSLAIRLAGFEIRDTIAWVYGSGFPKSQNVGKMVDAYLGCERTKVRIDAADLKNPPNLVGGVKGGVSDRPWREKAMVAGYHEVDSDDPASPEAIEWDGWGSAIKPAFEPICAARKPFPGTLAANVLRHGVGALNIEGCRISAPGEDQRQSSSGGDNGLCETSTFKIRERRVDDKPLAAGRWPANLVHDGSPEVLALFPDGTGARAPVRGDGASQPLGGEVYGHGLGRIPSALIDDLGSAARFFYCAKASKADRAGSRHPTVKPIALMEWLVRLVTPPGGVVLDPYAGSGTTGAAARRVGVSAILMEAEPEYVRDIARRLKLMPEPGPFFIRSRIFRG